jgi:hypothetical protein
LLERAIALDPDYTDPWFALVIHYMDMDDDDRLNLALRRLLESGIIADEVMDFNYNMLVGLEGNAILITNGDNDTYPGWILTHILNERPDVSIVNRSLLNTDWYPMYIIEQGLPRFIGRTELNKLRESILSAKRDDKSGMYSGGPFGDTLVKMIVASAEHAGRPVYFAGTLHITGALKDLAENGLDLGLVTLVTSSKTPYAEQLQEVYGKWLNDFRMGGMDGWRLRNSPKFDAGRRLAVNYAAGIAKNLAILKKHATGLRIKLFRWYNKHVKDVLPDEMNYRYAMSWCCYANDLKDVENWCKDQGMECKEPLKP